ncbi:hypothetical protein DSO57_1002674 [Entomophthora muscae]|nr:hypothetical protein DSO57_1002674 [Entomophthora muscae]
MLGITTRGLKVAASIASWFLFSTGLSTINKTLFGKDYNNFSYPLLVSSFHAALHFILAHITINYLAPSQFLKYHEDTGPGNPNRVVSFRDQKFWERVVPCGLAGGTEISTCNAALVFINLSFYTVVKSTVPIWVLLFSFAFRLEKVQARLIMIILVICLGVTLASINDSKFQIVGFILVLTGSITSGLKWCLTQILLQKDELGLDHPVLTLHVVAPIMSIFMFLCALVFEDVLSALKFLLEGGFTSPATILSDPYVPSSLLIVMGALAAFFMTLSEFLLIQLTSTLTLSVTGISKEIITIAISVLVFKDKFSLINYIG